MWFKSLQIYRLPVRWAITQAQLIANLLPQTFAPAGNMDVSVMGWAPPVEHGDLVHAVNGQFLLKLCVEKKLLPASVINEVSKMRAAEVEEQQGFAPGRKQLKALKESITDELLPRAFCVKSYTSVWIDPINGWLGIDTGSDVRADDVVKMLLKAIDTLPLQRLGTVQSPSAAMTEWLSLDMAPTGFTVDQDTELKARGEGKATVRYVRHTLETDDVRRHIASGKQCTRLALTWNDRVSFVLTEGLVIKRISPLDVMQENAAAMENEHERFDADFILMAGNFNQMLTDLIDALGGEPASDQVDLVNVTAQEKKAA